MTDQLAAAIDRAWENRDSVTPAQENRPCADGSRFVSLHCNDFIPQTTKWLKIMEMWSCFALKTFCLSTILSKETRKYD